MSSLSQPDAQSRSMAAAGSEGQTPPPGLSAAATPAEAQDARSGAPPAELAGGAGSASGATSSESAAPDGEQALATVLAAERRRADQAEHFASILGRLGAAPDLDGALACLARDTIAMLGGEQGAVRVYGLEDGPGSRAYWVNADGSLESADHPETLPGTVAGDLRAGGPPRVIEDLWELTPDLTAEQKNELRRGMRSSIAVPITFRDVRIGSLHVDHSQVGRFTTADLATAKALVSMAAPVIERARQNALRIKEAQEQAAIHVQLNSALREAAEARDRALAEAEEALGLRDKFLTLASHELRTPITSLRGYAQLLLRQYRRHGTVGPEQVQRALQLIDHQSEKLARLAMQLLDTTRIETGRLVLEQQPVDVVALVREVVDSTRAMLVINAPVLQVQHDITLKAPEAAIADVDRTRLEQVLINLLDNAIKYSPNGGLIDVDVSTTADSRLRCAVRDRGIGVPPAHRTNLFERFYQVQKRDNPSGMGLGLYVSRQIVEMHGGEMHAEFPEDGGSCFGFTLPLAGDVSLPESEEMVGDVAGEHTPAKRSPARD